MTQPALIQTLIAPLALAGWIFLLPGTAALAGDGTGPDGWQPLPETGIWFNADASGTGFMMEVQNDRLAGFYYLYDETGAPIWLAFDGTLEPAEEPDVAWTMSTGLKRYEGGACLNCPYQEPTVVESPGNITFEFTHRGVGSFRVDEADSQPIRPLTYGVPGSRVFQPHSDHLMPRLDSSEPGGDEFWILNMVSPETGIVRGFRADFHRPPDLQPEAGVKYQLWGLLGNPGIPHEVYFPGRMMCEASDESGPNCELTMDDNITLVGYQLLIGPIIERTFHFQPENITDSRIYGESEDGWIVEGHRIIVGISESHD